MKENTKSVRMAKMFMAFMRMPWKEASDGNRMLCLFIMMMQMKCYT